MCKGRCAIIVDDLIGSGTTIARTVKACRALGATDIYAAATHGLFVGDAQQVLADDALTGIVVTDSVPPFRLGDGQGQSQASGAADRAPVRRGHPAHPRRRLHRCNCSRIKRLRGRLPERTRSFASAARPGRGIDAPAPAIWDCRDSALPSDARS